MGWLVVLALMALVALVLFSCLRFWIFFSPYQAMFQVGWLGNRVCFDLVKRKVDGWWLGLHLLDRPLSLRAKHTPRKQHTTPSLASFWQQRAKLGGLLHYLFSHLQLERFDLKMRLATPDPALTAVAYGLCQAVAPVKGQVQVEPDFMQDWPGGTLEAGLRIRTLDLLVLGWRGLRIARTISSQKSA